MALQLGACIGEGGFGAVYIGKWHGQRCAVKQFFLRGQDKLIEQEIDILKGLRHRHIIQFFATERHDGSLVMITDFAEGGSLQAAIEERRLTWDNKDEISKEIAKGLAYIHAKHIIHRDLKSGNVLLTKHLEVKLCDFGLARVKVTTASKAYGQKVEGTFRWMAPELLTLRPTYSTKSDIYALGMVMWELAADCTVPFLGQNSNEVIASYIRDGAREEIPATTPAEFRQWIERCWHQEPSKRPEAKEIFEDDIEVIPGRSAGGGRGTGTTVSITANSWDTEWIGGGGGVGDGVNVADELGGSFDRMSLSSSSSAQAKPNSSTTAPPPSTQSSGNSAYAAQQGSHAQGNSHQSTPPKLPQRPRPNLSAVYSTAGYSLPPQGQTAMSGGYPPASSQPPAGHPTASGSFANAYPPSSAPNPSVHYSHPSASATHIAGGYYSQAAQSPPPNTGASSTVAHHSSGYNNAAVRPTTASGGYRPPHPGAASTVSSGYMPPTIQQQQQPTPAAATNPDPRPGGYSNVAMPTMPPFSNAWNYPGVGAAANTPVFQPAYPPQSQHPQSQPLQYLQQLQQQQQQQYATMSAQYSPLLNQTPPAYATMSGGIAPTLLQQAQNAFSPPPTYSTPGAQTFQQGHQPTPSQHYQQSQSPPSHHHQPPPSPPRPSQQQPQQPQQQQQQQQEQQKYPPEKAIPPPRPALTFDEIEEQAVQFEMELTSGSILASGGFIMPQDRELLVETHRKALEGDPQANLEIGVHFAEGITLRRDERRSVEYFERAAAAGDLKAINCLGYLHYTGRGVGRRDDAMAYAYFKLAAERGDPMGQCNFGEMFEKGRGVPKDEQVALAWYRKAEAQRHPYGLVAVGKMYKRGGASLPADPQRAFQLFQEATNQNSAEGQYELGLCYEEGAGVAKDEEVAFKWYMMASNQKNDDATLKVGVMYMHGRGASFQSSSTGLSKIQEAAENGHAEAIVLMGTYHLFGLNAKVAPGIVSLDRGYAVVEQNFKEALMWFRKGATMGDPVAQNALGYMYFEGKGVKQDDRFALKYFQLSADQGDSGGLCSLGEMYEQGRAVPQDYQRALQLYTESAAKGEAEADNNIGVMYRDGHGVAQDDHKAVAHFQKAVEKGFGKAHANLGYMYRHGRGVPRDPQRAAELERMAKELQIH